MLNRSDLLITCYNFTVSAKCHSMRVRLSDELQESLYSYPWYFPNINRKEADAKLRNTGQVGEHDDE